MQTQGTWTTDATGHIVGDDGFVVPMDFAEFYSMPKNRQYLDAVAYKHTADNTEPSNVEDTRQYFIVEMLYRRMIERYDPDKLGGANERRFFYYIGTCLKRMANSRYHHAQRAKRKGENVSIDDSYNEQSDGVTEEHIADRRIDEVASCNLHDRLFLDQFRAYVCERCPDKADTYMSLLDGVAAGETQSELERSLGISRSTVTVYMRDLRGIAARFTR